MKEKLIRKCVVKQKENGKAKKNSNTHSIN